MGTITTNAINGDTFKAIFESLIHDRTVEFHADNDMEFEYVDDLRYILIITIDGSRKFKINKTGEVVDGIVTVDELNNQMFIKMITAWRALFGQTMPDFRTFDSLYGE